MDDETFDTTFEEILAGFDSPAAESTATDAAAPEDADPPIEETDEPVELSVESEADPIEDAAPSEPELPVQQAPAEIDWNRPELKPLVEQANAWRSLQQSLAEAKRIRESQVLQETVTNLADGDPERHQQVTGLLAQVAAPLRAEAQQHERVATQTAQAATALHVAIRAVVPEELQQAVFDQARHLTQYGDPSVMERMAFAPRDAAKQYAERESTLTQKIAQLERQLAASQKVTERRASGADLVDGGGGAAPLDLQTRLERTETFDEFFDTWLGSSTGRRTA